MKRALVCLVLAIFATSAAIVLAAPTTRLSTPTTKPGATSKPSGDFSAQLEKVVAELIKQSESYNSKKGDEVLFVWSRPQKMIAELKAENAPAILDRIIKPLTKDEWRDSYIRWHFMPLILDAPEAQRKAMAKDLIELSKLVTAKEIQLQYREPWIYDPPDIGKRYVQLVNSCLFVKGFPPYQTYVGPPDSLALMDANRRRQCEPLWAEAQTLKDKFKQKLDPNAQAWNGSCQFTPWWQQMYRGEVFQAMLRTGEVDTLNAAMNYMTAQAKLNPRFACDIVTFLNASYINGELNVYSAEVVKSVAGKLRTLAFQNQKWEVGGKRIDRNLAEAAFHFVKTVEAGRTTIPIAPKPLSAADAPKPPATQPVYTASTIDIDAVDDAVRRATFAMMLRNPPDVRLSPINYWLIGLPTSPYALYLSGQQGMAGWALLACGESYQTPWAQKRINWVMADDTSYTFDRCMRLQMLRFLPRKGWEDWVRRDRDGLVSSITMEGNFPDRGTGTPPADPFGENANGQYGVMGLQASEQLDQPVDLKVWQKIDKYWREAQFRSPKDADGGWAQISFKSLKMGVDPGVVGKVSGPMTASGILALSQTERFMNAGKVELGQSFTPQLQKGIQWLDQNFNLEGTSDVEQDWFYYMWTIQNVGHATGYRRFKNVDYYREATAKLLNSQRVDGIWTGPKGEVTSTAFALLYLYNARGPLAICKLHFNSTEAAKDKSTATSWNNRPNDLVNFTDYLTEQYETPTSWLVAELAEPVNELIESPTLYLASDKGFTLADADVDKIREYINAGGLLVCAPEGTKTAQPLASMKALAKKLFPNREATKIDSSHPFYSLAAKVKLNYPMEVVSNSVRPLIVLIDKDISRDLQANTDKVRETFGLLGNIYLFATGQDPKRPRLLTNYVLPPDAKDAPHRTLGAVRIKYDGDFDPEPLALPQLSNLMARKHSIALNVETLDAKQLDPEKHQLAFLTVSPNMKLDDASATALRKWTEAGGMLWVDVAGGDQSAESQVDSITSRLSMGSGGMHALGSERVLSGKGLTDGYDVRKLSRRKFGIDRGRETVQVALMGDRPVVYAFKGDICCGLAGLNQWGIAGLDAPTSRHLVINTILDHLAAPLPVKSSSTTAPAGSTKSTNSATTKP